MIVCTSARMDELDELTSQIDALRNELTGSVVQPPIHQPVVTPQEPPHQAPASNDHPATPNLSEIKDLNQWLQTTDKRDHALRLFVNYALDSKSILISNILQKDTTSLLSPPFFFFAKPKKKTRLEFKLVLFETITRRRMRKVSLTLIHTFFFTEDTLPLIREAGTIPIVVSLLQQKNEVIQMLAALCLSNLALDETCKQTVLQSKAIQYATSILQKGSNPDVTIKLFWLITNLTNNGKIS